MTNSSTRSTTLRTSKNAAMLLFGTTTRMIAGFLFVIYCADRLGVESFGKYSIAIHYFELFLSLCSTSVGILLTREIARWPRHTHQLLTSATILVLILATLAPGLMWFLGIVFHYSNDTRTALMVASLALAPAGICAVFEAAFIARERAEFVTLGTAIESLLRIVLSFTVLILGYDVVALLWVMLGVRCGLLLAYAVGLQRLGALGWSFHLRRSRRFVMRWRVFAAENWMATLYTSLDVIVLSWISGEVAAGLYSAAWKIVRLGTVVSKSYTTAIYPVMSRVFSESRASFSSLYRHTIRVMCTLAFPAIAVMTMVPDRVIGLLFDQEYAAASQILQVLSWVLLIEFLNPFLSHVLFAQGKQDRSMIVAAFSLVVNSLAMYFLVVTFGAVGAALGTVIGGLFATVFYLAFTMPPHELKSTGLVALRVLAAAVGLAAVLLFFRESSLLVVGIVSVSVYVPLLILVGAYRIADLRFFQHNFLPRTAS